MAASGIGAALRSARSRLGWSREALAYRSGVSWSAIAQIESGRRKDVRLTSLVALAQALGVSVDYLIGAAGEVPRLFDHRVLSYGSDDEFEAAAVPYLLEGIAHSDCVLAITSEQKTRLLRRALGDQAAGVEFAGWDEWYTSPAAALHHYEEFLAAASARGVSWIRVVAEAGWSGQSTVEIAGWTRYESLVNLAFGSSPATILCTYDKRTFPAQALQDVYSTHPVIAVGGEVLASDAYQEPADFLLAAQHG
jgi:transcriptional regulator with XRE-family HTH domain